MAKTESQSPLPYKIALVAVALLAVASLGVTLYLFSDLRAKTAEWNDERATLERRIAQVEGDRRSLTVELDQIHASGRDADQASQRLADAEAEIRKKELTLRTLGQRTVTAQASLDRALKRQKDLSEKTALAERELDLAAQRLAPLTAELEKRQTEIGELEAVLRQARDGLDQAIERLERLGETTAKP